MADAIEKKNILVVDDEKEIAELIEIHLMSQDYNVTKAKNGVEALKMLDENHFDLVLLDVMMPKMDGKETLKKIREKNNVPVIMVTAKTSEKDKVEGLTLGADDYVTEADAKTYVVIKSLDPSESMEDQIKETEGKRLLAHLKEDSYIIALAIDGKALSSTGLAETIDRLGVQGVSHITFVIGGSLGLSEEVLSKAKYKLSFSAMTFPHHLARVMLLEQIYRAYQIQNGTRYHK